MHERNGGITLETCDFDEFTVYYENDKFSFLYADFDDQNKFIVGLVSYIFEEQNLLLYSQLSTGLKFNPGRREYVKLYKNIRYFLNEELEKIPMLNLDEEIEKVISEEYECFRSKDGELLIKPDKIGKIGEYIFHLLLSKYFGYKCILPKFRITTDRNMSVFGIDALFYDDINKELLFGESKFSKRLENGIRLVNDSLKQYEQNIKEEYLLVLSNEYLNLNTTFLHDYQDAIEICKNFEEFIEESNIKTIVIPIFIAHGGDIKDKIEKNLKCLDKVKKSNMLGLDTKYLLISLPVIDKDEFVKVAMQMAVNKLNEYENK